MELEYEDVPPPPPSVDDAAAPPPPERPPVWTRATVPSSWKKVPPPRPRASGDASTVDISTPPDLSLSLSDATHGWTDPPPRTSDVELECDVSIEDVLNVEDVVRRPLHAADDTVRLVQSLVPVWEEETRRAIAEGSTPPARAPPPPRRETIAPDGEAMKLTRRVEDAAAAEKALGIRGALTLDSGNATVTITSHPGMTGPNATKASREIDGVVHGRVKLGEDKDAASGASVPPVFAAGADLVVFVDFGTDPSSGALKLRTFTVSGDVAITKGSPGAGASFFSLTGDAKLSYPCLSGDAMTAKLKFNAKNKHMDVNDATANFTYHCGVLQEKYSAYALPEPGTPFPMFEIKAALHGSTVIGGVDMEDVALDFTAYRSIAKPTRSSAPSSSLGGGESASMISLLP